MTQPDAWETCGHPDEPADQQRDLADGFWAQVGPDERHRPGGWSWVILDSNAANDAVAGGWVADEAEAKGAVAYFERTQEPRHCLLPDDCPLGPEPHTFIPAWHQGSCCARQPWEDRPEPLPDITANTLAAIDAALGRIAGAMPNPLFTGTLTGPELNAHRAWFAALPTHAAMREHLTSRHGHNPADLNDHTLESAHDRDPLRHQNAPGPIPGAPGELATAAALHELATELEARAAAHSPQWHGTLAMGLEQAAHLARDRARQLPVMTALDASRITLLVDEIPLVMRVADSCSHGGDCPVHPDVHGLHDFDPPTAGQAAALCRQWIAEYTPAEINDPELRIAALCGQQILAILGTPGLGWPDEDAATRLLAEAEPWVSDDRLGGGESLTARVHWLMRLREWRAWLATRGGARALTWPDDGPATERGPDGTVYRKPTCYHIGHGGGQRVIGDRADFEIMFAFDHDGDRVRYRGRVTQDDLFRVLLDGGLLTADTEG